MLTTVTTINNSVVSEILQRKDGSIYVTPYIGGTFGYGSIIKSTLDGAWSTVVTFDGTNGATPIQSPIQTADGELYGTTVLGGSMNAGTVYRIDSNANLSTIHSFDFTNGANPTDLILGKDGMLYGVTSTGGIGYDGTPASGNGVAFEITTNGVYTPLGYFNDTNNQPLRIVQAGDGNFYGLGRRSGVFGAGTIFRMNAQWQPETLMTFNITNGSSPYAMITGSDGCLYGTTGFGGVNSRNVLDGSDTIFKVTTNGDFTTLHVFNFTDGASPYGRLLEVSNGVFYGTTYLGGKNAHGTIFKITTNGGFETLLHFDPFQGDNAQPMTGLIKGSDGNYYGTVTFLTNAIFCLRPLEAPVLQFAAQDGQINLKWQAWGGCLYTIAYKTNLNQTDWQHIGGLISCPTNAILSTQVPIGAVPEDFTGADSQGFYSVDLGIPQHWW
jgi:uncharacterized repeat protein (TIGR03803 family)